MTHQNHEVFRPNYQADQSGVGHQIAARRTLRADAIRQESTCCRSMELANSRWLGPADAIRKPMPNEVCCDGR